MSIWLRRNTATTLLVGPFVSSTDGVTAQESLTITQGDVLIWKNGGTSLNAKNESTAATHRSNGYYTIPIDATDTNTGGQFFVTVLKAGCLPVRQNYLVVDSNVWDSWCASDFLKVDLLQINGNSNSAVRLGESSRVIIPGVIYDDGGTYTNTTTTLYSDDITEGTPDHYNGRVIIFTSGALTGQATTITDYALTASTYGTFTVDALTEAPVNNTEFVIV